MLLCLCQPLGFPLSTRFSRGACASSLLCHSLPKPRGSDTHRSARTLVRRHALPPLHSLPSSTATTDHFLLGQSPLPCLLGVIRSVTSQAPLQVLLCSLSKKSWHSSEEGIWARISLLLFQRSSYEPGPIVRELKLPTVTPHPFLNPQQLWKILSNPGFREQRYL